MCNTYVRTKKYDPFIKVGYLLCVYFAFDSWHLLHRIDNGMKKQTFDRCSRCGGRRKKKNIHKACYIACNSTFYKIIRLYIRYTSDDKIKIHHFCKLEESRCMYPREGDLRIYPLRIIESSFLTSTCAFKIVYLTFYQWQV